MFVFKFIDYFHLFGSYYYQKVVLNRKFRHRRDIVILNMYRIFNHIGGTQKGIMKNTKFVDLHLR